MYVLPQELPISVEADTGMYTYLCVCDLMEVQDPLFYNAGRYKDEHHVKTVLQHPERLLLHG